MLHWNGTAWTPQEPPFKIDPVGGDNAAFSTTPSGELYFVGFRGLIARHDGDRWTAFPLEYELAMQLGLSGVCATASDSVFAVSASAGPTTSVLHFDGTKWSEMETGVRSALNDVWCAPEGKVFAVGDSILVYDPQTKTPSGSDGRRPMTLLAAAVMALAVVLVVSIVLIRRRQ